MEEHSLESRLEALERQMAELSDVPGRIGALVSRTGAMELQIVQLRKEMRDEFAAAHREIRDGDEETRRYMRVLHEDVIARIAALGE